ncbi:MAG: cytochrome c-type biogenesis protein CcmH/NrfG [Cellvibrionaceae bacterium]|jgi:cytochrome c-type biogenesis protein CcmH/NrfG
MRNLQTAWKAIEMGDHVEAQSLVAQILRDDPRNAEAWMVLGEAVSGERQVLFLRKALQLDPSLTLARQRLEEITEAEQSESVAIEGAVSAPSVPPNVSLDAPTISIAERLNADRAAPQQVQVHPNKDKKTPAKSESTNTIMLVVLAFAICIVIYFLVQSLLV